MLIGVAKVIGGVLALALAGARPGRPARVLRMAAWTAGILLAVYGLASMVNHALMVAGAVDTPESLGRAAARWHLAFWDPWWILGGVLFVLAAWNASGSRGARAYSEDAGSTPAHGS